MIINAWESFNYPIYSLIWHPEYLLHETITDLYWIKSDNGAKRELSYRTSKFFHS